MTSEPTNAEILEAIDALRDHHAEQIIELRQTVDTRMTGLERRTTQIENARAEARSTYDRNWEDVRTRLERIEFQTTRTNGRMTIAEAAILKIETAVAELREWKAYMSGVAASFSWWKPALAAIAAGVALWLITR